MPPPQQDGTQGPNPEQRVHGFGVAILTLLLLLVVGCAPLREFFVPTAPGIPAEWAALVAEIRAFEEEIGFTKTGNFRELSREQRDYPFCGFASPLVLPYSYEDPAIEWREVESEDECRRLAGDADTYFGTVEALGEIGTPVTLAMIESRLDRFLYLVIHEDCHDQFELPYGIEEALCNLIAYRAMAAFTNRKFGALARENRAIRRYATAESRRTRATKDYYEQLAALYELHRGQRLSSEALLARRDAILVAAQRTLALEGGRMNNVVLASHMTYSRHYSFLESVLEALGGDLARMVEFFRRIDKAKPAPAAVMRQENIASEDSVEFVRAYEASVIAAAQQALPGARR